MTRLKINLFINGNDIISYQTVVATICGKRLLVNGTYSNTTSRHIKHVAEVNRLTIVKMDGRPVFETLPTGTKL